LREPPRWGAFPPSLYGKYLEELRASHPALVRRAKTLVNIAHGISRLRIELSDHPLADRVSPLPHLFAPRVPSEPHSIPDDFALGEIARSAQRVRIWVVDFADVNTSTGSIIYVKALAWHGKRGFRLTVNSGAVEGAGAECQGRYDDGFTHRGRAATESGR
jgi:phosphotransferase system IIB component